MLTAITWWREGGDHPYHLQGVSSLGGVGIQVVFSSLTFLFIAYHVICEHQTTAISFHLICFWCRFSRMGCFWGSQCPFLPSRGVLRAGSHSHTLTSTHTHTHITISLSYTSVVSAIDTLRIRRHYDSE